MNTLARIPDKDMGCQAPDVPTKLLVGVYCMSRTTFNSDTNQYNQVGGETSSSLIRVRFFAIYRII